MTEDDLDIVARPANTLQARTRWERSIGVKNLAEGFAKALREELDLRVEARNIAAVSAARSDGPVRSAMRCSPSVARTGRNSHVLRQVILDGVFHADPQPGNIMLLDDGRLGMLDVGSVGRIDAQLRSALQKLLLPVDRADPAAMCDALLELVSKPEDIDEQQWERALGQFTARHLGAGMRPDVEMSGSLFRLVHRCGWAFRRRSPRCSARSPRWRAHSARSLPGFNIVFELRTFVSAQTSAHLTPESLRRTATEELHAALPILRRLPRRVDQVTGALEQGRLGLNVRLFADEHDRQFVTGLLHQVMLTVLGATSGVMAVLLLGADSDPQLTPPICLHQAFGYNLLVISGLRGLRVVVTIFQPRAS
jgi:ubiquinone biosynthesis protein